ncbi:hypothetical protein EDB83DRAFT_2552188 [Lactarius deliciosus]|nr:hypothetical protein EDB83DRAFT_2552188 [Lactarius deliciosus]
MQARSQEDEVRESRRDQRKYLRREDGPSKREPEAINIVQKKNIFSQTFETIQAADHVPKSSGARAGWHSNPQSGSKVANFEDTATAASTIDDATHTLISAQRGCRHEDTDRPTRSHITSKSTVEGGRYCGVRRRLTGASVVRMQRRCHGQGQVKGGATAGEEVNFEVEGAPVLALLGRRIIQVAAGAQQLTAAGEPEINVPPYCTSLALPRNPPKASSAPRLQYSHSFVGRWFFGVARWLLGSHVIVCCKVNPTGVGRMWNILRERALRRPDSGGIAIGAIQRGRGRIKADDGANGGDARIERIKAG